MKEEIQSDLFGETITKQSINREQLTDYLFPLLCNIKLDEFVGLITNEFNEIIEYIELTNDKKACQKTSLLFNPHRLNTRSKNSKKSIFEALKDKNFISGLSRALIFKKGKVNELLYQVIQLGINGIQYINEFPPHLARNLCKEFGVDANSKVLDPCAGWGGRMLGISTVTNYYSGCEPCIKTFNGLIKLKRFIQIMNPLFNTEIWNSPFEDCFLKKDTFDFAITSPPYYDTEIYSDEATNSLNRYKTFDSWCEYFYLPMINNTMSALKTGKSFVLNIGNRVYPLDKILLDNFDREFDIKNKGNLLSGSGGLGREKGSELFFIITK